MAFSGLRLRAAADAERQTDTLSVVEQAHHHVFHSNVMSSLKCRK
jgi:hypothetical protein